MGLLFDKGFSSVEDGSRDKVCDHAEAGLDAEDDEGEYNGLVVPKAKARDDGDVDHCLKSNQAVFGVGVW